MHTITKEEFASRITTTIDTRSNAFHEEERRWTYPVGCSKVKEITLRPGLTLLIETFDFSCPFSFDMMFQPDPVEIFFCTSGKMTFTNPEIKDDMAMEDGCASLFFSRKIEGEGCIFPCTPLKLVTVRFHPELICHEIIGLDYILPDGIQAMPDLMNQKKIIRKIQLTPDMKMVICQILNCPFKNTMRRIYLDTKAVELILLYCAALTHSDHYRLPTLPSIIRELTPEERKKIYQARDILNKNMEDPPGLISLARQVGLNKDRLNQGFRKEFGISVFACFREQRMVRAKELLISNEMSVTQVSYALGFSQPGTFSRAFKDQFGISPKAFHKKMNS